MEKKKKERPRSRFVLELESNEEVEVDEKYELLIVQYEKERKRSAFFYKQVGQLEIKVDKITKIYNNLNEALKSQENTNDKMSTTLEEKEMTITELRNQLELSTKESAEFKDVIYNHQESSATYKDQITILKQELAEKKQRFLHFELKESEYLDKIAQLEIELNEKTTAHNEKMDTLKFNHSELLKTHLNSITDLNAQIKEIKDSYAVDSNTIETQTKLNIIDSESQTIEPECNAIEIQTNLKEFMDAEAQCDLDVDTSDSDDSDDDVRYEDLELDSYINNAAISEEPISKKVILDSPERQRSNSLKRLTVVVKSPPLARDMVTVEIQTEPFNGFELDAHVLAKLETNEQAITPDSPLHDVFQQEMDILQQENTKLNAQLQSYKEVQKSLFEQFDKTNPEHAGLSTQEKLDMIKNESTNSLKSQLTQKQSEFEHLQQLLQINQEQLQKSLETNNGINNELKELKSEKEHQHEVFLALQQEHMNVSDGSTNADVEFNDSSTIIDHEGSLESIRKQYIEIVSKSNRTERSVPIENALDDLASCLSQLMFQNKSKSGNRTTIVQLNQLSMQMQEMRDDMLLKDVEIRSLRDRNEVLRDKIRQEIL